MGQETDSPPRTAFQTVCLFLCANELDSRMRDRFPAGMRVERGEIRAVQEEKQSKRRVATGNGQGLECRLLNKPGTFVTRNGTRAGKFTDWLSLLNRELAHEIEKTTNAADKPSGLYTHRTAGGHSHHCHPRRPPVAGAGTGQSQGTPDRLPQQLETIDPLLADV